MARTNGASTLMRLAWTRTIVALFWFVTAAYCLLSSIPFASEQFLKPGLVPALSAFARWHPWISLAALAATSAGLLPWLPSHRGARAFVAAWTLVAVGLIVAPPLSRLESSTAALALALASLLPPFWISLMNLSARPPATDVRADAAADDVPHDFAACALAALVVTATNALVALPWLLPFGVPSVGLAGARSLLVHLVIFSIVFALISVVRGAARLISDRPSVEAWLTRGLLASALALFISSVVLRPLSLVGSRGAVVAAAFGTALAVTVGPRGTRARPGLAEALGGLVPRWATRSGLAAIAWLAVVACGISAVERQAATTDWNFTIAKTAALTSWLLALAAAIHLPRIRLRGPEWAPFAACLVLLGLNQAAPRLAARAPLAVEAWASRDPSSRLIADALAPAAPSSDAGFADFLQHHTNIPRSARVEPVTIDLAALDGSPSPVRPHIFLFVIDSLRRDYLSPYNRDVSFTPALERFARESTVFERAFTHYGATGLSVPALWVGGLVLHKQYVTPFAPMNALAKLVEHEQYDQWIGMDNILDVILPASARRTALDAALQVADFRFCRTLDEIRGRLGGLKAPAFVYSLPQDIHISAITREGAKAVDAASYGTFYAPYASRVRRLDACFGAFIDDLKQRGLFDDSVIIVTSDHGDSLGEEGRMGHAYTIFPEVIQVPLLVHLPRRLAAGLRADTSAPAFTTDLAPTLYALLGHEPRRPAAFFGRPLFRKPDRAPLQRSSDPEVVASSYGSVYGTLLDDARRLYVFDGIALREHEYALDGSGAGRAMPIAAEDRARSQRAIRATVDAIATFYGYRR